MDSFFLSETCKYLYLLFDPDNFITASNSYIFNTEGHPFPLSADLISNTGGLENSAHCTLPSSLSFDMSVDNFQPAYHALISSALRELESTSLSSSSTLPTEQQASQDTKVRARHCCVLNIRHTMCEHRD